MQAQLASALHRSAGLLRFPTRSALLNRVFPAGKPRWWQRPVPYFSLAELIADGVVHGVGLLLALAAGAVLLLFAGPLVSPSEISALIVYLLSLVVLLSASLAYNLWPWSRTKANLARLDQAAIFLFIAGSYTPFLAMIEGSAPGWWMPALVWGLSAFGMALKLFVPDKFGRVAILLCLGIGWSGVLMFKDLVAAVPPAALWLLVGGGLAYSFGLVFHLWERLKFQNVLWHVCVVLGAALHLGAVLKCLVLDRI